jgi:putative hydrolase of the HAD superfamily
MKPHKIILWDVYGTLISARAGDLQALIERGAEMLDAFQKVAANFSLQNVLRRVAANKSPAETLRNLYLERIKRMQDQKKARGIEHPEVRIEEVWLEILQLLADFGLDRSPLQLSPINFAREISLTFERAANPKRLYPTACETLLALRSRQIRQGIISNAQFYTRIELNELLQLDSDGKIASMDSVFDKHLVFLSCDLGVAKPAPTAFERAVKAAAAFGVAPDQCAYVGNDMLNDILTAHQHGFFTVLFAGDPASVKWRRDDPRCADLKPDAVIKSPREILQFV